MVGLRPATSRAAAIAVLVVGLAPSCLSPEPNELFSSGNAGSSPSESDSGSGGQSGGTAAAGGSDAASGGVTSQNGGQGQAGSGGTSGGSGGGSGGSSGTATGGTGGSAGGGGSCTERCDGIDSNCGPSEDNPCPAGCTGSARGDAGYMFCIPNGLSGHSWDEAQAECAAQGMRLVWIETEDENAWITATASSLGVRGAWIGATDQQEEGTWMWQAGVVFWMGDEDGEPVENRYANWSSGRPNNSDGNEHCAVLEVPDGQWNDLECTMTQGFVCEDPAF